MLIRLRPWPTERNGQTQGAKPVLMPHFVLTEAGRSWNCRVGWKFKMIPKGEVALIAEDARNNQKGRRFLFVRFHVSSSCWFCLGLCLTFPLGQALGRGSTIVQTVATYAPLIQLANIYGYVSNSLAPLLTGRCGNDHRPMISWDVAERFRTKVPDPLVPASSKLRLPVINPALPLPGTIPPRERCITNC